MRFERLFQKVFSLATIHFEIRRQACQPLHQGVIHERLPNFQSVRHAGAINFGIDVAHQVCLEIEVLDQRKGMIGACPCSMPF